MRLFVLALLVLAAPATAQTVVSAHAGGAEFDLSGVGQAVLIDVRLARPVTRILAVEGGLGLSNTSQQFGDVTYLLPSAELQLGVPLFGALRPFIGAGVGALVPIASPDPQVLVVDGVEYNVGYSADTEATVLLALGLDADVADRWLVRFSGRVRGTVGDGPDVFVGTFSEVTAGLGYRL